MRHEMLKEAFMQGDEREAARMFREMLRSVVRAGLLEAMEEEVTALCGAPYSPDRTSKFRRAGSVKGMAYMEGTKEEVLRPRVRRRAGGEVRLATYQAASSPQGLFDQVVSVIGEGLPARGYERTSGKALSKSEASRMWVDKSREQLTLLRSRPLDQKAWLALIVDGVFLTKELCVVVAVGIAIDGSKQVLDFEEGPSENATVVSLLLDRIKARGFGPSESRRLLILRDGSGAIETATARH